MDVFLGKCSTGRPESRARANQAEGINNNPPNARLAASRSDPVISSLGIWGSAIQVTPRTRKFNASTQSPKMANKLRLACQMEAVRILCEGDDVGVDEGGGYCIG